MLCSMDELAKLKQLIETPGVTDLVFIGHEFAQGDFGSGLEQIDSPFSSRQSMSALLITLALEAGSRLDMAKPIADFALFGARFNAVLAQGISDRPLLSIRVHPKVSVQLKHLVETGMISEHQHRFLLAQLHARRNILISGATSSGKTTLLQALLGELSERVLVLEQTSELRISPPALSMTERISNQEGLGAIELGDLVVSALRMRPDRIVVGEVRSKEFKVLLQAMNNGHSGTIATLHSASIEEIPERLAMLGILSGLSVELTNRMAAASVHLLVQLERVGANRKLVGFARPLLRGTDLVIERVEI